MAETSLSECVAKLAAAVPSVAAELQLALDSTDPKDSLSKSRLVLEKIVKQIALYEGVEVKGKTPGQILPDKNVKQVVPVEFYAEMQFVYSVASEYGSHVGVPPRGVEADVLKRLCQIVDWYSAEYMGSRLVDNFGKLIDRDEKLVLYVSSGGTDRCAMANVITRHYLWGGEAAKQIRPMSVALNNLTGPTMSLLAVEILREEFGIDASQHKSIRGDERYWRRAQLVLAMDAKLHGQLPLSVESKSALFSEFFGSSGNITDPFNENPQVYRDVFHKINSIIQFHTDILIRRLERT